MIQIYRFLLIVLPLLAGCLAWAGPNDQGTLQLHANPAIGFSAGSGGYCGQSA